MTRQIRTSTARGAVGLIIVAGLSLAAQARVAEAVPVPWKNCGAPTDAVTISQLEASLWPPAGFGAPLTAMATFDPSTGALATLDVVLLAGGEWLFQNAGTLGQTPAAGFVALPSSLPVRLYSPTLPISAGPLHAAQTFFSAAPGGQPITIKTKGNLGTTLSAVNATLTLTFNGTPGFPVSPSPGTYEATLQMTEPSGAGILCFDITLQDAPFVLVSMPVPALLPRGLAAIALALAVSGTLVLRRG